MYKVLLVDDDPFSLAAAQINFEEEFEVVSFESPYDAMKYFHKGNRVDCVVTDYMMPSINGIDFCEALSEYVWHNGPVILLTAFGHSEMIDFKECKHITMVIKPCEWGEVVETIKEQICYHQK